MRKNKNWSPKTEYEPQVFTLDDVIPPKYGEIIFTRHGAAIVSLETLKDLISHAPDSIAEELMGRLTGWIEVDELFAEFLKMHPELRKRVENENNDG